MEPFDIAHTPLAGINLIEASAGTGKTYAIEGLFLRLLIEKQIPLEKILVVTFTKAATAELSGRIRSKLVKALSAFRRGTCDDPLIDALLTKIPQRAASARLLEAALVDYDRASIFTIHGFCQRILHEHAFETGNLFDTELVTDPNPLLQEIADDFWRRQLYPSPPEFVSYVLKTARGPEYFFRLLKTLPAPDADIVPPLYSQPSLDSLPAYRCEFQRLQSAWPGSRESVIALLKDPALNGRRYGTVTVTPPAPGSRRDAMVSGLAADLERLLDTGGNGYPLFQDFVKLTGGYLAASVRKGHQPPVHPFFDGCDRLYRLGEALEREMDAALLYLKRKILADAPAELRLRKRSRNIMFFDDLLIRLRQAIRAAAGDALVQEVRSRYAAALVDEFQDTDTVQYEIFSHFFAGSAHVLFMIGDPKQAIYGFRGADIFSYIHASREAAHRYTLLKNWRAGPGLNRAVNTIFANTDAPFVFDEIAFSAGESALENARPLDADRAALELWFMRRPDGDALTRSETEEMITDQVAAEIVRLLSDQIDPAREEDIAVLVRTNRQALRVKSRLADMRVPAVLYRAGNVFESHQALDIYRILRSVSDPGNEKKLKAAWSTETMGFGDAAIGESFAESDVWDSRRAAARTYHDVWRRGGFMRMFRALMGAEQLGRRLLTLPDGERRFTNVLHLAELLHRRAVEKNAGMTGLVRWLEAQMAATLSDPDAHQLRLESDARAVKIVTIHKSKGLEYPIVFCPFCWEASDLRDPTAIFHDPDSERLILDLQPEKNGRHVRRARTELLAENLRLLYVALTRAKSRCYLAWGHIKGSSTSALAYLLHREPAAAEADVVDALVQTMSARTPDMLYADLERLAGNSGDSIRIVSPSRSAQTAYVPADTPVGALSRRTFSGRIDTTWQIKSYSSLVSRPLHVDDVQDRDALFEPLPVAGDSRIARGETAGTAEKKDIFSFPRGARAGNFFHDLFENAAYDAVPSDACRQLVADKLREYAFSEDWSDTVCEMLHRVLQTPLPGGDGGVRLSSVPPDARINEMPFYFPLRLLTPRTLKSVWAGIGAPDVPPDLPERIDTLTFSPARGFMKGYIDLVFRHRDLYYIVDWKSNYLGPRIEDYHQRHLTGIMQETLYVLQYQIYTLALDRYLSVRLPGYRYENNFGGVFYLFCRGIDGHRPEYGVYADRPSPRLLESLGRTLIPGYRP